VLRGRSGGAIQHDIDVLLLLLLLPVVLLLLMTWPAVAHSDMCRFTFKADGRSFTFICTHFDHEGEQQLLTLVCVMRV
jgi:hypothetical protein